MKYKEYDNRERRSQMKSKRTRKVFERRNNVTQFSDIEFITEHIDFAESIKYRMERG